MHKSSKGLSVLVAVAAAVVLASAAMAGDGSRWTAGGGLRAPGSPSAGAAAVLASATGGVPGFDHIVVVVEENHAYSEVNTQPYLASLVAGGANFTGAHAETHPSQPNYLDLWSGSDQGVTTDACTALSADNLGAQTIAAGLTVSGYSESLPSAGSTVCSSGAYAKKHNPVATFTQTADPAHNLPFSSFPSDYSALPRLALVVPNLINDMHDGSVQVGDDWLRSNLGAYASWATTHNSLLIVTFDEDDKTAGNLILNVFYGAHVVAGAYAESINHYNDLTTIEASLGLPSLNSAAPITDVWDSAQPTPTPTVPTPPTVVSRAPASGSSGVATGSASAPTLVTARFSEAVTGVGGSSFTVAAGTTPIAGAVSYDPSTFVATFRPGGALASDTVFTASLTSAIRGTSGDSLSPAAWPFTTGPGPTLTGRTPASGATAVGTGSVSSPTLAKAQFSEAVTGVSASSFMLKAGTSLVVGRVSYDSTTHLATFTPSGALLSDTTYTASLTSSINDVAGNPLTAQAWPFLTGPRPTVTARTPAANAAGVNTSTRPTATFSEAVTGIPTTAAATSNMTLTVASTGSAVKSTAVYNATTRTATLTPAATLATNTRYSVHLSSRIKDAAGNPLTATVWSFGTGGY